jgi:hypothetical protein
VAAQLEDTGVVAGLRADQDAAAVAGEAGERRDQAGQVARTQLRRSAAGRGAAGEPELTLIPWHSRSIEKS